MKKKSYLGLALHLCLIIPGCGQMTFEKKLESLYKNTVPLIKPAELLAKQSGNDQIFILDTRDSDEFQVSHLKDARLVGYENFEIESLNQIPKDAEIIVYCSVGYRSERVGEELLKNGYTDVKNLYGGLFEWKNQNLEVYNSNQQPTDSVHTYNKNWSKWLKQGIKVY
jgi:rhodanese-related sulfurtransferase